jgi:hypothetical protein
MRKRTAKKLLETFYWVFSGVLLILYCGAPVWFA